MKRSRSAQAASDPIYFTSLARMSAETLRDKLAEGPEEAARIAYAAAVGGSIAAQLIYGQMLLDGHGVPRDLAAAFRWFGIAAKAGDADGINMLGRCHELGWGTPIDIEQARACYERAAANDHAWAQFNLATLLLREEGRLGRAGQDSVRDSLVSPRSGAGMLSRRCAFGALPLGGRPAGRGCGVVSALGAGSACGVLSRSRRASISVAAFATAYGRAAGLEAGCRRR